MSKFWKITGSITVRYMFDNTIEANTENAAIKKAESDLCKFLFLKPEEIIERDIKCERLQNNLKLK